MKTWKFFVYCAAGVTSRRCSAADSGYGTGPSNDGDWAHGWVSGPALDRGMSQGISVHGFRILCMNFQAGRSGYPVVASGTQIANGELSVFGLPYSIRPLKQIALFHLELTVRFHLAVAWFGSSLAPEPQGLNHARCVIFMLARWIRGEIIEGFPA